MASRVTVVNGSPHGEHSHTMVFVKAFVRGMSENEDVDVSTINVYASDIKFCDACMSCIVERQGVCSIHDDMDTILPKLVKSDVVIWAVPLMNSAVPAKLKVLIERLMPTQICGM